MKTESSTIKIQREDGSIFAVIDTYKDEENKRFLRINVVEDSDWLHVEDMQQLAIQLFTSIMKLQHQDNVDLKS